MKLSALASQYVAYKQGMGMRFHTEARTLKSFCRNHGRHRRGGNYGRPCARLHRWRRPVTRFWHRKYEVLRGFYRFAIARGYVALFPASKDRSQTT